MAAGSSGSETLALTSSYSERFRWRFHQAERSQKQVPRKRQPFYGPESGSPSSEQK